VAQDQLARPSLVAVGGSWGGTAALRTVLRGLGDAFDAPIVVVLHRAARSNDELLERILRDGVARDVCEVDDKTPLTPACVFVGPADYHLLVEEGWLALSTDAPVNFSRPSIDVLFESAADAYGAGVVAVVLTGANDDGAVGVRRVLERGGRVVVQDPAGAERAEMPNAAIAAARSVGGRAEIVPLDRIAEHLLGMVGASR
jgi:two-component system chemotaxis response regulator CheB